MHGGRGLTSVPVVAGCIVLWAASCMALTACHGGRDAVGAPVVAGVDSPDEELAQFLDGMIQNARSLPDSGLMRGRLAMAYENNLFPEEALVSYAQAAAPRPGRFSLAVFQCTAQG